MLLYVLENIRNGYQGSEDDYFLLVDFGGHYTWEIETWSEFSTIYFLCCAISYCCVKSENTEQWKMNISALTKRQNNSGFIFSEKYFFQEG